MNVKDFTYILQNPNELISSEQTKQLEDVLSEFPYFQAARAVYLKGLKNGNSFKYNNALKVAASYTTDRDILFDFITSNEFLQNSIADSISGKSTSLVETEIVSEEVVPEVRQNDMLIEKSIDEPLPQTIDDADHILDPNLFKSKDPEVDAEIKKAKKEAEKELEIGQPLTFTQKEKYSFSEWLQLTSKQKIERKTDMNSSKSEDFELEKTILKEKKFELINKFIAESPKIVPNENPSPKVDTKKAAKFDANELMTETLAKVYLEQKKYKKAMQAYRILSLKYPEKSGFFADRIRAIEKIQQENI
ncbi:hypothetical protein FEE95_08800 [Maribacter algarum]|uniref:Tetratricopeptide repeat protein n=1 Tax=Maribacter algarum (ex Zhang et al. 2020) TaxID=2578118 RepID=A0A5S3QNN7_9FLAO|nr:hypothetical protein [Maribacter algarum]TMM59504.1 hypothetical protein FEE95_08800 [Maribacter algarum]